MMHALVKSCLWNVCRREDNLTTTLHLTSDTISSTFLTPIGFVDSRFHSASVLLFSNPATAKILKWLILACQ